MYMYDMYTYVECRIQEKKVSLGIRCTKDKNKELARLLSTSRSEMLCKTLRMESLVHNITRDYLLAATGMTDDLLM